MHGREGILKRRQVTAMRNHEVTNVQLLLDEKGELREPGWSRSLVQKYRRDDIKAPAFRIKEWRFSS